MGTREAIKLRTVGQGGESGAQVNLCVAIEVPLADEPAEASKDGEGDDLTRTERSLRSWPHFRGMGVAEVVSHDVECRKEGVHIDHEESVPFPSGSVSKPTLASGHLPLKSSMDNSHQAFKG